MNSTPLRAEFSNKVDEKTVSIINRASAELEKDAP